MFLFQSLCLHLNGRTGKFLGVSKCCPKEEFFSWIIFSITVTAVSLTPKDWKMSEAMACAIGSQQLLEALTNEEEARSVMVGRLLILLVQSNSYVEVMQTVVIFIEILLLLLTDLNEKCKDNGPSTTEKTTDEKRGVGHGGCEESGDQVERGGNRGDEAGSSVACIHYHTQHQNWQIHWFSTPKIPNIETYCQTIHKSTGFKHQIGPNKLFNTYPQYPSDTFSSILAYDSYSTSPPGLVAF